MSNSTNEVRNTNIKKNSGLTILEMLLALAIISFILTIIGRQMVIAQNDANARQLEANIDRLFQAAANYYYANCRQQVNETGSASGATVATLDPANLSPSAETTPFPVVNQASNLLTSGKYLLANQTWPPAPNSYLDNAGTSDDHGYTVQFNPVTSIPSRLPAGIYSNWETASGSGGGAAIQSNPRYDSLSTPVTTGKIYTWRIQVSVKLSPTIAPDATTAASFQKKFGADCTSTKTGGYIAPCSANTPGTYLVWERLPSFASPQTASNYWLTMPGVKTFNQLYTNDDIYGAENPTWGTNANSDALVGNTNNYLCGG